MMKKHISILIPKGHTSLVNIVGAYQLFSQVNTFLREGGGSPLFDIELVGLEKPTRHGRFSVHPEKMIEEIPKTDLIIIPAIHDEPRKSFKENAALVPWLIEQYEKGAEIASFCVAAFLLAHTGLLEGKQCSTHWIHAGDFRKMFPGVRLLDDRILTEDEGIYTSGGAYSYLNLLIYLVEKYVGSEMALLASKTFMIEPGQQRQSPFIIFQGQKGHKDQPVRKAQEFIEANYREKISVPDLASRFAMSRRSLERRFKKATSNTPVEYIQRVKIEAAKKSLESQQKSITEVMFEVGYCDEKAFRKTFKKFTGISPAQYRGKFNRKRSMIPDQVVLAGKV